MARATVLEEVRAVFEPNFHGTITVRPGERFHYPASYESVLHFLGNVYRLMSPARKRKFREALGILFAEQVQKSGGSATLILGVVALAGAYEQLPKMVQNFNDAKIAVSEANVLLYDFLAILKGVVEPTESTYEVLRQLVDGPKFKVGYAIEALQLELECDPSGDYRAVLY